MSYRMRTDARSRKTGRFVRSVQEQLQNAVIQSGLRQQQVAEKLGVHKSIIGRRLSGQGNLTLRSIADIAWATDHDIEFRLKPKTIVVTANERHIPVATQPAIAVAAVAPAATTRSGHVTFHGDRTTEVSMPSATPTRNVVSSTNVRQHETA